MASEYLDPFDELMGASRLSGSVEQAAMERNPLYQRDQAILAKAAAPVPATSETEVSVAAPATVQSNPFIKPPVPISTMSVDKQIAWQKYQSDEQTKQAAREKLALDTAVTKSTNDLRLEQIKQGNEFMKELPRLQAVLASGKTNDYANLKSELVSKHPLAMGADEVQKAIKSFDDQHGRLVGFEENRSKTEAAVREKALQKSIDDGFEMVKPLGPEASQRYAAKVAQNPEEAIQYATSIAAPAMRENTIQRLKDQGFSDEEIAKYGTGPEFKYQAAEEAGKSRAALTQEKYKVGQDLANLHKQRMEAKFDPNKAGDPYARTRGKWDPVMEQTYQATVERLNSLAPQLRDNRAGVQGMQDALGGQSLYRDYTIPATAAQSPMLTRSTLTQPAVPVRTGAPPQRVPVTQQRIQPTPTPVPTAATPKPTPAPPPLNPAYPEHWVSGKRYIQMPDGKLYLSKVQ